MRLCDQVTQLKEQLAIYEDGNREIYEYCSSKKFQGFENHGVNVSDIISRVVNINSRVTGIPLA